ncbi:DUF3231 family protein [Neobacillus niacini]|uniref:DUF3231 family protein n=1 Tax=Neobacillus niacini TaxID=86668 RepID=UPI0028646336|nr:DUF3231 family protein [Neobacillus niacini]MDR6999521.1 hypothetical protein [Neobacillus niacini]
MVSHTARLSSSEIGGLWALFLQEDMGIRLLEYFLHHNQDEEIQSVLEQALATSIRRIQQITEIFTEEGIPLPDRLTNDDIDLSAPPLFYDTFALSFVYSMGRMTMVNMSFITSNVARMDVLNLFTSIVKESANLYQNATTLMLKKGIYDRPPMIPYPKKVEYIEKQTYILGLGKKRPLNTPEITEIFFNVERNYFSIIICTAFLQIVKDKEIRKYIKEGKEISEKQIRVFNDLLMREELLGIKPTTMEVTDSQVAPFSDKLIVLLFHSLNAIDITFLGHALSLSMRTDLAAHYQKFILEILLYAEKGFNIMVDRGWMQQPPHAPNRRELEGLT